MSKITKKQWLVGGGMAILMSPVMLVGAVAYVLFNALEKGWVITEHLFGKIDKILEG